MVLRFMQLAAAGLTGAAAICPLCLESPGAAVSSGRVEPAIVAIEEVRADTARVKLAIKGMTCASCATTARIALERSEGVFRAEVSYDSASAVVDYDPERTAPPRFIATLEKMTGYRAAVIGELRRSERTDTQSRTASS